MKKYEVKYRHFYRISKNTENKIGIVVSKNPANDSLVSLETINDKGERIVEDINPEHLSPMGIDELLRFAVYGMKKDFVIAVGKANA